jgi:hypothetical protein
MVLHIGNENIIVKVYKFSW